MDIQIKVNGIYWKINTDYIRTIKQWATIMPNGLSYQLYHGVIRDLMIAGF